MAEILNEIGPVFIQGKEEPDVQGLNRSEALGVSSQAELKRDNYVSSDVIHYIVMSLGMFARKYNLTKKEACNYLSRFKGLDFSIRNYEAEHQLSLQECVEDMAAICRRNGGLVS